jgi:hypothetical protein
VLQGRLYLIATLPGLRSPPPVRRAPGPTPRGPPAPGLGARMLGAGRLPGELPWRGRVSSRPGEWRWPTIPPVTVLHRQSSWHARPQPLCGRARGPGYGRLTSWKAGWGLRVACWARRLAMGCSLPSGVRCQVVYSIASLPGPRHPPRGELKPACRFEDCRLSPGGLVYLLSPCRGEISF